MSKIDISHEDLVHFGIPGMKWGVRKTPSSSSAPSGPTDVVVTSTRGRKTTLKAKGGTQQPPSKDAIETITAVQKSRASGMVTLSNSELRAAVTRMNLEQQYIKLTAAEKNKGQQFIEKLLGSILKESATKFAKDYSSQQIAGMLGKNVGKAGK